MITNQKALTPRIKQTRQQLSHALLELMREKQFAQITVNNIAEQASINRTTFYDHYTDKYALFEDTVYEMFWRTLRQNLGLRQQHPNRELTEQNLYQIGMQSYVFMSQFRKGPGESVCHEDASMVGPIHLGTKKVLERWIMTQYASPQLTKPVVDMICWSLFGVTTELIERKHVSMKEAETEFLNMARMLYSNTQTTRLSTSG